MTFDPGVGSFNKNIEAEKNGSGLWGQDPGLLQLRYSEAGLQCQQREKTERPKCVSDN